jgi:outer membrane receptor protein involved in Fe transport
MIIAVASGTAHAQAPELTADAPGSGGEPSVRASSGTVAAPAPEPVSIDELTVSDDLLAATGFRPIGTRRGELLVATGTDATHHGAARVSDTVGGAGIELTGTMLSSDVLGARNAASARIEHSTERDRARLRASYEGEHVGLTRQSFVTDTRDATYGAAWTAWRSVGRFELETFGEQATLHDTRATAALELDGSLHGVHAGFGSRRVQALDVDHEFAGGIDLMQASGINQTDLDDGDMLTHMQALHRTKRGRHRFLSAYIHDTVRVIESLDVHAGFVFEHWSWLTSIPPLGSQDAVDSGMDVDAADVISELFGPRFGAVYRVAPSVAFEATAYRKLRTPTWHQLMRPIQNGDIVTDASDELHAETITGGQVGPSLSRGKASARAVVYWNEIASPIANVTVSDTQRATTNLGHARETGLEAAASWRLAAPVLAGASYTFAHARVTNGGNYAQLAGKQLAQTPRHRATALLAYDEPRLVTLTGAVRYLDRRFEDDRNTIVAAPVAVVDASAARKLTHGLAGFVSVENVFDRRYVTNQAGVDTVGAPRLVQVGVRLDSARW